MFEIIATLIALVGIWYIPQVIALECGKMSFLWDIVPERNARLYMRVGKLSKAGLSFTGYCFQGELPDDAPSDIENLKVWDITSAPNEEATRGTWEEFLDIVCPARGVIWIGLPGFYEIYKYEHTWIDDKFEARSEPLTTILVAPYNYGQIMNGVELEGQLKYNFKLWVTMQVVNPAMSQFRVTRYVNASMAAIESRIRTGFSKLSYNDFASESTKSTETTEPLTPIGELPDVPKVNKPTLEETLDSVRGLANEATLKFGVRILHIEVREVEAADKRTQEIAELAEIAKREGEAKIASAELAAKALEAEARGKATAIGVLAEAEAKALLTMGDAAEKLGDKAIHLKELETIKGSELTLFGGVGLPTTSTFTIPTTKKGGS